LAEVCRQRCCWQRCSRDRLGVSLNFITKGLFHLSDTIDIDPVAAGKQFARKVGSITSSEIAAIRANAQNLFISADPISRWTAEYHRAFCDEIEALAEAQ
jgi:hypothetical protein